MDKAIFCLFNYYPVSIHCYYSFPMTKIATYRRYIICSAPICNVIEPPHPCPARIAECVEALCAVPVSFPLWVNQSLVLCLDIVSISSFSHFKRCTVVYLKLAHMKKIGLMDGN